MKLRPPSQAVMKMMDANAVIANVQDMQRAVARHGGVESVLEAMRLHPTAETVQQAGCWALREF
eukprot:CAMPEP_0117613776 /NCGR_PEP_ID=MMETSP0784-20121206/83657_1 /TAXON_ID=39447 /ORGANISM="" /LENGTH=63 /DNA_ID=CAMNT_0005417409 /DNA_START=29 /DNA_END=217 /DNA_ORIENTATION=+